MGNLSIYPLLVRKVLRGAMEKEVLKISVFFSGNYQCKSLFVIISKFATETFY